jgi:hypothetical protein
MAQGEAYEEGVGWVDAAAIRYHRRRCMLMVPDVQVSSSVLQAQYRRLTLEQ